MAAQASPLLVTGKREKKRKEKKEKSTLSAIKTGGT